MCRRNDLNCILTAQGPACISCARRPNAACSPPLSLPHRHPYPTISLTLPTPLPYRRPVDTSVGAGSADASAARPGVVEASIGMKIGDTCASVAGTSADPSARDKVEGWNAEDEDALHCLCRLPADTARFRTLMTCDLCHRWFHPACIRLKVSEIRFAQESVRVDHRSCRTGWMLYDFTERYGEVFSVVELLWHGTPVGGEDPCQASVGLRYRK